MFTQNSLAFIPYSLHNYVQQLFVSITDENLRR